MLVFIQMWSIFINCTNEFIRWLCSTVPRLESPRWRKIVFFSELMVQSENKIISLTYGADYFRCCSMALTTFFITLTCVKFINIISSHKITEPFSELTAELASVTFISPEACFTLTTATVIFYYIQICQLLISNDTLIFMLLHPTKKKSWQDFITTLCNFEDVNQIFYKSSLPATFLCSAKTTYSIGSKESLKDTFLFNLAVTHIVDLGICFLFICFYFVCFPNKTITFIIMDLDISVAKLKTIKQIQHSNK